MAGYTRQSTANIVAGQAVNALPLANEFNAIEAAFHGTTGHAHDGNTGNGPRIDLTTSVSGILPVANGGTGLSDLSSLTLVSTDAGASAGPDLILYRNSASPIANDIIGRVLFQGEDDGGGTQDYAQITGRIDDPTAGAEDGSILFQTYVNGSIVTGFVLTGGTLNFPSSSILNWNSSDLTLTHSPNVLTLAGGDLRLSTTGTDATSVALVGGIQTLTNKTFSLGSNTVSGTTAQFNTALSDGDFATLAGSETLTNKTINLTSNTLTGTLAQFNTAVSDADLASLAGSETLSNKTLTSPIITTSPTAAGATWTNLGTVTTADINGGTIDGTTIGGSSAAAITCTTFTSTGIDDNATGERVQIGNTSTQFGTSGAQYILEHSVDNQSLALRGGTGVNSALISLYGSTEASSAGDILITSGTTIYQYDASATKHSWIGNESHAGNAYISGATRIGQDTTNSPGNGNNTVGAAINTGGQVFASSDSGASVFNRTADSTNMSFASGGTGQGSISISGGTVTYGTFCGSHESQFSIREQKQQLLVGTVMEAIDERAEWYDFQEEHLPRTKVSDTPESRNVYGVFFSWYDSNPEEDTFNVASLGAFMIRIDPNETVQMGDYLVSAGNGCAKVQTDDILRSCTIGKVTGTKKMRVYDDGSYCVSCTLHCG